ncbi:sensor histidine kinase [Clostridioides difficile]|nr:sensor histidine kinase [Clostridioides difficile]
MKTSILIALIEKTSLIVVLFLLITKLKTFKQIFQKEEYSLNDLICISLVFTFLAIFGTYNGINYMGSIVNTRIISIVSGGVLFGPIVGITAGLLSGTHRYFMDIGGITSMPCLLSSILAGVLSGFLYKKIPKKHRVIYGILVGMISESFTILLIYLISQPHSLAIQIINGIYLPLIVGQIGIGFVISIVEGIEKDKKDIEARNKAEIKALQRQINPHFLFNSLNTIASFIRFNPDKARELIINLSTYLRYNLEYSDNLIDINKEIEQVKSFVEIEKARFGDLLTIIYDIDDVNIKIPSLIIQPIVENAIIHGILESGRAGVVKISIKKLQHSLENTVRISIEDDGIGISEEVINNVYQDNMPENKIGLYNVHLRLKLMYGSGLNMRRTDKGTLIMFYVKE